MPKSSLALNRSATSSMAVADRSRPGNVNSTLRRLIVDHVDQVVVADPDDLATMPHGDMPGSGCVDREHAGAPVETVLLIVDDQVGIVERQVRLDLNADPCSFHPCDIAVVLGRSLKASPLRIVEGHFDGLDNGEVGDLDSKSIRVQTAAPRRPAGAHVVLDGLGDGYEHEFVGRVLYRQHDGPLPPTGTCESGVDGEGLGGETMSPGAD